MLALNSYDVLVRWTISSHSYNDLAEHPKGAAMAVVTWRGGTGKVTDASSWSPGLPASGDVGIIEQGDATAVGVTLSGYILSIAGTNYNFPPTLNLFQSTIGPNQTIYAAEQPNPLDPSYPALGGGAAATIVLFGVNSAVGGGTSGLPLMQFGDIPADAIDPVYDTIEATIDIADVTGSTGSTTAIQAGRFTSSGTIVASGANLSIRAAIELGGDSAQFVNNGAVNSSFGSVTVDIPVSGTGTFGTGTNPYSFSEITFDKYVGSGQTINIADGALFLQDPKDFYGTIAGISGTAPYGLLQTVNLTNVVVTRGTFDGSTLFLFDGDALVAHFVFADKGLTAAGFRVPTSGNGAGILYGPAYADEPTVPITSGPGPTIVDPGPQLPLSPSLPTTSGTITLTTETRTLTRNQINGCTVRLEGTEKYSFSPAVSMTFGQIGAHATILAGDESGTAHFGNLNAVGYNDNLGQIVAEGADATSHVGTLLEVNIENVDSFNMVTVQPGVLNNSGAIIAEDGATLGLYGDLGTKMINTGTLSALNGADLFVSTAVTGTGNMVVDQGGTLEIQRQISTGQSIDLKNGNLIIDDPADFYATIYDATSTSRITFGLSAFGPVIPPNIDAVSYNNGKLSLFEDGAVVGALHFHRPNGLYYDTSSFHLTEATGTTPAFLTVTPHTSP